MLTKGELEKLLLESAGRTRYTQDSPVFVDVWMEYCGEPAVRKDLLLEPHYQAAAGALATAVRKRLSLTQEHRLAYAGEYVAVWLNLPELLAAVLPLSGWWKNLTRPHEGSVFAHLEAYAKGRRLAPAKGKKPLEVPPPEDELKWFLTVAGRLLTNTSEEEAKEQGLDDLRTLTAEVLERLGHPKDEPNEPPLLWSVSRNREVHAALWRSRLTVKADAACRLFPAETEGLAWAVIDSGIDAKHPAFRRRDEKGEPLPLPARGDFSEQTTVRATYDFTELREKIAASLLASEGGSGAQETAAVEDALAAGLAVDWRLYVPLVEVPHAGKYVAPVHQHGTHVAGTIAGDWRTTDSSPKPRHTLQGVCPGLDLFDLRVLDERGVGTEFGVLAALSFVRWRNAQSGGTVVHGVNLSISLEHDVRNSACGRSPVCLETERVHYVGVVVVTVAGNEGRAEFTYAGRTTEGYRTVSITDPGNTEVAITVGSTHRIEPHAYGVSYFSSRGPTGDGRAKPDIVAPGEKITAPVPGEDLARMDGTSMAAPHVSGAAALLMARHRELVGQPARVKSVLCESATDLGRERHYQGHGMLDILRALQAV